MARRLDHICASIAAVREGPLLAAVMIRGRNKKPAFGNAVGPTAGSSALPRQRPREFLWTFNLMEVHQGIHRQRRSPRAVEQGQSEI
jgi:hypothetical protein